MMSDIYKGFFIFLVSVGLALPALGNDYETALALYKEGKFLEAADAGEAVGTSDSLALAASALAIHGYYIAAEDDKQALFERGVDDAIRATELDPENSEAFLQISHTKGRYAQTIGVMEAMSEGYAEQIKEALDTAIALDSSNHNAHISLAAWHAEIVAAGFMARTLYGASEDEALANYKRALELAPDASNAHLEYAVGLMTIDEDNAAEARTHLRRAIELPAEDAYAKIVRAEAEEMLAELGAE